MGISIHYSGKLKSEKFLPELIEEVKDIAAINKWQYLIFEKEFPLNKFGKKKFNGLLYGISFSPPDCESVCLTFLPDGALVPLWILHPNFIDERKKITLRTVSVKTQFAGPQAHKIIIHLLDFLSKKYLIRFKMSDEAKYWETRDEALLEREFKFLGDLINGFRSHIETIPMNKNETIENYILRIAQGIHKQKKK